MNERSEITDRYDVFVKLGRFNVLRELGHMAATTEGREQAVHKIMDSCAPADALEAPEGMSFLYYPTSREDNLMVYVRHQPTGENDSMWVGLQLDAQDTHPDVRLSEDGLLYFVGHSITYDREDRKVLIYSKSGNSRIEFTEGISIGGLIQTPEESVTFTLVHPD